jgi:hypothetical protein
MLFDAERSNPARLSQGAAARWQQFGWCANDREHKTAKTFPVPSERCWLDENWFGLASSAFRECSGASGGVLESQLVRSNGLSEHAKVGRF